MRHACTVRCSDRRDLASIGPLLDARNDRPEDFRIGNRRLVKGCLARTGGLAEAVRLSSDKAFVAV